MDLDADIRWSPFATQQKPRFLTIDYRASRLKLCQVDRVEESKRVKCETLAVRDRIPIFSVCDWSKTDEHIIAIGCSSGEAALIQLDAERPNVDFFHSFPIKHQRGCNAVAFSEKNYLASGLDRVRNDFCLNVYDLNVPSLGSHNDPFKKLATSEAIHSIKFFSRQPDTLIAGVGRQCIRIYDLRGTSTLRGLVCVMLIIK